MAKDKSKKKAKKVEPKKGKAAKESKGKKAPKLVTEVIPIPHLEHLDKVGRALAVVQDKKNHSKEARKKAARFLVEAREATLDRQAAKALADAIDRADATRVVAYNETQGRADGHYLTSDAERDAAVASLASTLVIKLTPDEVVQVEGALDSVGKPAPALAEVITDAERKARIKAKKAARANPPLGDMTEEERAATFPQPDDQVGGDPTAMDDAPDEVDAPTEPERQEAEEVETETGREFSVGPTAEPGSGGLSGPAEDENTDFDLNGLGQYKVWNPEKKAERGYTRVTTYIDCLEDKGRLTDWKTRQVLIGAGLDATGDGVLVNDTIIGKAVELYDAWKKAYRKTAKREKAGELDLGQFGLLRAAADKALREGGNVLAELALEYAGANEKREKGTDLHKLTERFDRHEFTLDDEESMVEAGLATHADFADLRAYDAKMRELGIEHVYIEKRVVLDGLKVAGTLDRGSYYKLPGATRRTKLVADLKTGRVDYSAAKIGMQLGLYATGEGYDREHPEAREKLGLSKTVALLIHLPAGEATCTVYVVDLTLAAKGLKLAAEVRTWRNVGKKVYDLKAPLGAVVDTPTTTP